MKRLLLLIPLLAACPEQVGSQCPSHTVSVGEYTLTFTGAHPATECQANFADGGDAGALTQPGFTKAGTFCFGTGSDGGPAVSLIIAGKGVNTSDLLADGGFHIVNHASPVSGTACACDVSVDETIDGFLLSSAPVAVQSDGGLPVITSVSGTLKDTLSFDGGTTCLCQPNPCDVIYGISGSRF